MDVSLASQTHHVPHVGLPQKDPVTIEIKVKIQPMGAKLLPSKGIILILKIKLPIEAIPINPKIPKETKDEGT